MNADIKQPIYHISRATLEVSPLGSVPTLPPLLADCSAGTQLNGSAHVFGFCCSASDAPPHRTPPTKTTSAAPPRSASLYNEPHSLHLLPSRRPTCLCVLHLLHYINTGFVCSCPLKSPAGGAASFIHLPPTHAHTHTCILCVHMSCTGSCLLLGDCANRALSLQTRREVFAHSLCTG